MADGVALPVRPLMVICISGSKTMPYVDARVTVIVFRAFAEGVLCHANFVDIWTRTTSGACIP